jgi:TPR repeat protein
MKVCFPLFYKAQLCSLFLILFFSSCQKNPEELNLNDMPDLPEILWTLPKDWTSQKTTQKQIPWKILLPKDLEISIILQRGKSERAIWPVTKIWRNSLKLPIMNQVEIQDSMKWLDNGAILFQAQNKDHGVYAGFFIKNNNLWTIRFEASVKTLEKNESDFRSFLKSIKENPKLKARITALETKDDVRAYMKLAAYYSIGKGTLQNNSKAENLLEKARVAGSAEAAYQLALVAIQKKKIQQAIDLLNQGVQKKHIKSIKKLAGLVLKEKKDHMLTRNLLLSAAEMGDTDSMYFLGTLYCGENSVTDEAKAVKWIKMAAAKKHRGALRTLGVFYQKGYVVEKNIKKAITLLESAAELKDILALEVLAEIYYEGKITEKNSLKSVQYLIDAAAMGSSKALLMLANLYFNGDGIEKNNNTGFHFLEKAIQQGSVKAMLKMADIFSEGKITVKSLKVSYSFYQMAALKGNPDGMFHVSMALFLGKGCKQDEEKGMLWLTKAAKMGHAKAIDMLKKNTKEKE